MTVPQACIFDLDGVIVDTAGFHFKAWKRLADRLSIPFTEKDNEALKGVSRRESLMKILRQDNRTLPEKEIQQFMDQKNRWYLEYVSTLSPKDILAGVPAFLDQLASMSVKLAIGSSSKNAKRIIELLELNSIFDTVVDGTAVKRSKPDPEVFLKGADALQIPPAECLVFEDAASGIRAARRARMACVGVGSEFHLGEADTVIPSFENMTIQKLLNRLNN